MAAAPAANAIEIQQQIKIIDACEKYRTRVSFIEHDLRRSTRVVSSRRALIGLSGTAVYKDTIQKGDPPYDNVPVTDSDRDRILNNIRDAFRSQGFEIDVI